MRYLTLFLALPIVAPCGADEVWELRIHKGPSVEEHVLTEIDSITIRLAQVPGVCCIGYGCVMLTEDQCTEGGGEFHPEWQSCYPNPCPGPLEAACCEDGGLCILRPEEDCQLAGGIWHPEWSSCDPNPCPSLVRIPAGTFIMGYYGGYCEDEHEVTLTRDFYLGQHEVTNQEYMEAVQWAYDHGLVHANVASVWDNLDGSTEELLDLDGHCEIQFDGAGSFYLQESPSGWAQEAYPDGYDPAEHPVKEVTWYGAARCCDWLSLQAGLPRTYEHTEYWTCNGVNPYEAQGYRLPTDAEWEYAAQWNDDRIFPWGDEDPDCIRVNYWQQSADPCVGWTTPVGSYPDAPEAVGLSDMAGNIFEWCHDWNVCHLGTDPMTDPAMLCGANFRIIRGGDFLSNHGMIMCAFRMLQNPPPHVSNEGFGFRIARTIAP